MRISSKSRYAINTMLELALNGSEKAIKLADISEKQGISLSYLEQLFASLRTKGLVIGRRGPGGGYALGRASSDITITDIICAVDEWVEYTQEKLHATDKTVIHIQQLSTRNLWDDLSVQIFDFLSEITLHDLITGKANPLLEEQIEMVDDNLVYTDRAA